MLVLSAGACLALPVPLLWLGTLLGGLGEDSETASARRRLAGPSAGNLRYPDARRTASTTAWSGWSALTIVAPAAR